MELRSIEILPILQEHGVGQLFHANMLRTSCSFLREGRLVTRGMIEEFGLPQTPQISDANDLQLGLWFDLFLTLSMFMKE